MREAQVWSFIGDSHDATLHHSQPTLVEVGASVPARADTLVG
jgi:hypothetical protein